MVAKPEGGRDPFCQAILSISKSLIADLAAAAAKAQNLAAASGFLHH